MREQLARLAELDVDVVVEEVPGDSGGLDWRTRVTYAVSETGRPGLREHRSHHIVPIDECRIAHPLVRDVPLSGNRWPGGLPVDVSVSPATGDCLVLVDGKRDASLLLDAARRDCRLRGGRRPVVPGDRRRFLAGAPRRRRGAAVGGARRAAARGRVTRRRICTAVRGCSPTRWRSGSAQVVAVTLVESDRVAVADARHNLRDRDVVRIERGRVDHVLRRRGFLRRADLVVLDPPRSGAGRAVVDLVARLDRGGSPTSRATRPRLPGT